ncbi:hypothetical protein ACIQU5_05620 [Streptomyces sp. NPDC090306]|uniref:hypothetical protein n=1 Tax=Streptomyces sp. NPDC090306 TaxID=3365961 RepID=UPI00380C2FBE
MHRDDARPSPGGRRRRAPVLGAAVLTAAVLLGLLAPATAVAAGASGCPGHLARTVPFATGSVRVYKRDGYVCAVTVPRHPGTRRTMSVSVQARGNRAVVDRGRYAYRAGPVRVHAGHRCVRVGGTVGTGSTTTGWILC